MVIGGKMSKPTADDFEYRLLQEADLPALSLLIRSMSKGTTDGLDIRNNSEDYYRWMYFRNPAGSAIVASAWHNEKLVSSFAMAPKKVQTESGIHTYGKTMDMFTNPDYQGLGIMSRLTRTVFSESVKRGIDHWYVTPSGNSYPIFRNKWNYVEPFRLAYRMMIISPFRLSAAVSGNILKKTIVGTIGILPGLWTRWTTRKRVSKSISIEEIKSFPDEINDFWHKVSPGFGNVLVRDQSYLNWRYCDNPDDYRIYLARLEGIVVGYIVSKVTRRRGLMVGDIVDILYPRDKPGVALSLLRYLLHLFAGEGCAIAEVWDYSTCPNHRLYRKAGLFFRRAQFRFVLSPDGSDNSFYDPDSWYVTQGDGNDI